MPGVEMKVFQKDSYKKSVRECFYKACQFPNEDGTFRRYLDVKSGLVGGKIDGIGSVDGDGTDLSRGCLADNLAELEVVPNPDQREAGEWSEEESGDEEDLEDEDFLQFLQCGA